MQVFSLPCRKGRLIRSTGLRETVWQPGKTGTLLDKEVTQMDGIWCMDICRYSRHCMYGKKEVGKDPDHCIDFIKLEELEWEAFQDRMYEAHEREPEDDDDWEE